MIELELFYNISVSAIREEQAEYLKGQRSQPFPQELPSVDEVSAEEYAKMTLIEQKKYKKTLRKQMKAYRKALKAQKFPVDEKLIRGYNAGIEMALRVISREFKTFNKRIGEQGE